MTGARLKSRRPSSVRLEFRREGRDPIYGLSSGASCSGPVDGPRHRMQDVLSKRSAIGSRKKSREIVIPTAGLDERLRRPIDWR